MSRNGILTGRDLPLAPILGADVHLSMLLDETSEVKALE